MDRSNIKLLVTLQKIMTKFCKTTESVVGMVLNANLSSNAQSSNVGIFLPMLVSSAV